MTENEGPIGSFEMLHLSPVLDRLEQRELERAKDFRSGTVLGLVSAVRGELSGNDPAASLSKAKDLASKVGGEPRDQSVAKRILREIEREYDSLAKFSQPEYKEVLDGARALSRAARGDYDAFSLAKLATSQPEKIVEVVMHPGQGEKIRKLRSAIGEDAFHSVRESFLSQSIGQGDLRFKDFDERAVAAALDGKATLLGDWLTRQLATLDESGRKWIMERLRHEAQKLFQDIRHMP